MWQQHFGKVKGSFGVRVGWCHWAMKGMNVTDYRVSASKEWGGVEEEWKKEKSEKRKNVQIWNALLKESFSKADRGGMAFRRELPLYIKELERISELNLVVSNVENMWVGHGRCVEQCWGDSVMSRTREQVRSSGKPQIVEGVSFTWCMFVVMCLYVCVFALRCAWMRGCVCAQTHTRCLTNTEIQHMDGFAHLNMCSRLMNEQELWSIFIITFLALHTYDRKQEFILKTRVAHMLARFKLCGVFGWRVCVCAHASVYECLYICIGKRVYILMMILLQCSMSSVSTWSFYLRESCNLHIRREGTRWHDLRASGHIEPSHLYIPDTWMDARRPSSPVPRM